MRLFPTDNLPWNGLGGTLSFLCLIHCLALPWLAVLLPVAPLLDESVHLYLFLLLTPIAALAAWQGLSKHGKRMPPIFLGIGLVLVALAMLLPVSRASEIMLTAAGSLLLLTGHVLNSRPRLSRIANPL
jgi:hypothetical protein